ncbi:glycosyltransferase [Trinickia dinghuensis]|uniref:Glycosyltransferase n=1 Tax=Trinickia dinghuensis TaxID=2291023 RepID=A0A3D8JSM5_9BURK|nr:glycosyltransferase [Trinickia dinghuensis]RDU96057.1 glycosyltransferase [Trinickia dinghuensis]
MGNSQGRVAVLLHIVGFGKGGIESALMQWLRIFDRSRFDVTLSVMFSSPAFEQHFRARVPADVKVEVLADRAWLTRLEARRYAGRLGKFGRVCRDVFNTAAVHPYVRKRLATLARQHDVLIDFDMSLRRWVRSFDIASVAVSHFSFNARFGHRPRKVRRLSHQLRDYDRVIALNQQMADEAPILFGNELPRPFLLPNAIDVDAIRARANEPAAPRSPVAAPYIVSVARLDELQKDHRTLLHAYARLLQDKPIVEHLVLVGDGAFRQELEACAASLGIAERTHFVGHVDNPHALIAGASLFILSSRNEGQPMGLLEALAHGKPVVSTDCPTGPRDILDHGRAGILLPVGDIQTMADAMGRILSNAQLREEMSAKALARAQHYGIEASKERLALCVGNVLKARHHPKAALALEAVST